VDYTKILKTGEVFTNRYTVQESDTADASGNKGVRVLSTPSLLKYIELGSSAELFKRLPKGYSPVGTSINLKHIGATPINGIIEVVTTVYNICDSKITYDFKVFYNGKIIAKGDYEQKIVYLEGFLEKNNAK